MYIYIYTHNSKSLDVVQSLYFGSKLPSSGKSGTHSIALYLPLNRPLNICMYIYIFNVLWCDASSTYYIYIYIYIHICIISKRSITPHTNLSIEIVLHLKSLIYIYTVNESSNHNTMKKAQSRLV